AQIQSFYDPYRVKAPLKRTNAKGVSGEWKEISWDEALTLAGEKIKEVRKKDKRLLIWQKGRSKSGAFYDTAFVKASGATYMGHGTYCSDAGYRALEYTIGQHGVLHPDFRHCNYLVNVGWNLTNSGGNKFCWIVWPRQFLEAKKRGMKMVTLDPRKRAVGPHTDEWLPIRPGTDLAFFLALANVLVEKGFIDREYLTKHTNSPFLVQENGHFLKVAGKEQVWDNLSKAAAAHDAKGIEPALEGDFSVEGKKVKTAFQLLKEHVAKYTPEWASDICGLPAESIRKVGENLGEKAMIGSTVVLEGVKLPYRPVGIMAYHMAQQELGFQSLYMMVVVFMLLGAIEAVGGLRSDTARSVHSGFKGLDSIKIKDPPYDILLKDSKFFPINSGNPSIAALTTLDPKKYGVDYTPEVMIIHYTNPLLSFPNQAVFMEAYKKYKFIAVIDPWMSETADFFADVVLPAATVEKYEGPFTPDDQYVESKSLRLPPIPPLFQSKGDIDIYIDLCEKSGILFGKDGYIDQINAALPLKGEYQLPLDKKPNVRDIFDRWAKQNGFEGGIRYFEEGKMAVKAAPANKLYAPAWSPPYGGIKHRLYGESLLGYREVMKEKGAPQIYWQDYNPLPTWRSPTMNQSPSQYDLYLISQKKIEFKQSRTAVIPLLNELDPQQRVEMNAQTARSKGLQDGDEVVVESHNAVTGETKSVKTRVQLVESLRPDTVSMSHHYGQWVHPWAKGIGPTPNSLFPTGEGYVTCTADQSFHVKVKVTKA
ncbi:MAG: molybdopterin oxidoreductase, partial [Dehalococcoidia bacterium]|nr:molybdopterin oxidoreductase [Dehalococcoidia bacterium]